MYYHCCASRLGWKPCAVLVFTAVFILRPGFSQPFPNSVTSLENQKPGTTNWKLTNWAPPVGIEGYASLTSVKRGSQIDFLVNTTNSSYVLEVYRVGWYGGAGGRQVFGPVTVPGTVQLSLPPMDTNTGLVECTWTNPYTLYIPANPGDPTDWASGVYLAKITGSEDHYQNHIIFVVRDDDRPADLLAQVSFTTYEAYNVWGGVSLYRSPRRGGRAGYKVSFNRPLVWNGQWAGSGDFFSNTYFHTAGWECNLVRWMEREGYDVSYCSSIDTHTTTNLLWNHKGFISMGHDEYWSYPMRWNVQAARDRGVNLAFLSSNTSYWQVRFEPAADGTPNRTMVCYKSQGDPIFNTPSNYLTTTAYRSLPVPDWESSLLGVCYQSDFLNLDLVVNDPAHWIFANTGLKAGQHLLGLLGYEVDSTNQFSPAGVQVACASPYLYWQGGPTTNLAYSDAASYTAPSGATVFACGSMQWTWGLDDFNVPNLRSSCQNPAVQQVTRNILARMINQPPPSPTLFFRTDVSTAGNWKPSYGVEGQVLPGDATNLPAYATVAVNGAAVTNYLPSSSDTNSLQQSAGPGRQLSGWSSPTNFILDLNLTDGQNHQVALYFWDSTNAGRTQTVDVVDMATSNLLDHRTIAGFTQGQWWVWQVTGHVQFQFTSLTGPDCLLNGLAFGSGSAVQFIGQDTTTQGNWQSLYGEDGACIAGDLSVPPAYGNVVVRNKTLIWSPASSDPRALLPPGTNSGPFAAWIAAGDYATNLDLNLTDTASHQLAVYCVDAEGLGRKQTISLIDPHNNTVLDSQVLTNFTAGTYLVWNVQGSIRLQLQTLCTNTAVLSGIFFGGSALLPPITITSPPNGASFQNPTNIILSANAAPDSAVTRVDFYQNTALIGSASGGPPYSLVWTNAPPGTLSLVARAVSAVVTTNSPPVNISVSPPYGFALAGTALLPDGRFQMSLVGTWGTAVRVDATTSLGPDAFWVPVLTNTSGSNQLQFVLDDPLNFPTRFYRAVTVP